jgi:hypothetical protein
LFFAPISTVLAKTGYRFLSFGQKSIQWPNILRRKTQKREQPAENRRNFAVTGYWTCHCESIICLGVIDVVDNFFITRIGYITQMLRLCSKNVKGLDNPVKVITFARK